jgi:hypothetical protein
LGKGVDACMSSWPLAFDTASSALQMTSRAVLAC